MGKAKELVGHIVEPISEQNKQINGQEQEWGSSLNQEYSDDNEYELIKTEYLS